MTDLATLAEALNRGTPNERPAPRVEAPGPKFDHAMARTFLQHRYRDDEPAALVLDYKEGVSIPPGGSDRFDAVLARADSKRQHLFFHVSTLTEEWHNASTHTTAEKEHTKECEFLWLDCDAAKYTGSDPDEAETHYQVEGVRISKQMDDRLKALNVGLYAKWRSAAGWQALIRLDHPITPDEAEDLTGRLHAALGADPVVRNRNRILRVAGSVNWKNDKDGRVPAPCSPCEFRDDAVTAIDHIREVLPRGANKDKSTENKTEITIDWDAVPHSAGWLIELPDDLPPKARIILEFDGTDLKDLVATLKEAGLLGKPYSSWSDVTEALVASLKFYGKLTVEQMAAGMIAKRPCNHHVVKLKSEGARHRAVKRALESSHKPRAAQRSAAPAEHNGHPVVSEGDHMKRARTFIDQDHPNLQHYRDDFVEWDAGRYRKIDDGTVKAGLYNFLDGCQKVIYSDGAPDFVPFQPGIKDVNETINAARAVRHVSPTIEQPCWLDGREGPDPSDLVSCRNGILDLRDGSFSKPDVMLFTPHAVGVDYNPKATEPGEWKKFLGEVYADEQDQIDALQEMFGYCISSDVSQEKSFIWLGPRRSGKDTSKNMLLALMPDGAVCGPTLDSMGTNFGMSQFINKQLAIVGDMRLGSKCDKDLLAENVLKLTGRGLFTIDRKHQSHWTGRLPCKLLLISNEMPAIKDTSGALASRQIIFQTRTSFYGREDPNLFRDKLAREAPGVLLWVLEGLKRMRARGRLAEPKSSTEARLQLARDGSPVLAFAQECLKAEAKAEVGTDVMYAAWVAYAARNGLHPTAKNWFIRDLKAATGGKIGECRLTLDDGRRPQGLRGARIVDRSPEEKEASHEVPF